MAAFNQDNTYYLYKEHIDNPLHNQIHNQIHKKIHNKIQSNPLSIVFPHILIKTTVINNQFNQIVKKTIKTSNITNVKNESTNEKKLNYIKTTILECSYSDDTIDKSYDFFKKMLEAD